MNRCLSLLATVPCLAIPAFAETRVFITDSQSWEVAGGFGTSQGSGGGAVKGGSRPQTVEIIKTFGERCPEVTVTMNKTAADYVILFDREGGKVFAQRRDKIAVFHNNGDVLFSGSTRNLGNSVKDACAAILGGK